MTWGNKPKYLISQMIKVHPLAAAAAAAAVPSSSSSSSYVTSRRETFTVWMKSLVMQGNGCTVYNENGEIVYRVDNYDKKCSDEVCLMDLQGKVLFTILRKVFESWNLWLIGAWNICNYEIDVLSVWLLITINTFCRINGFSKDGWAIEAMIWIWILRSCSLKWERTSEIFLKEIYPVKSSLSVVIMAKQAATQ